MVRGAEANVMVVSSAGRALDVIATFRPHVVISDLAMPGMDGYALVGDRRKRRGSAGGDRHVRARERTRPAAIAGSRVREAPGQARRLRAAGADDRRTHENVNFAE